MEAPPRVQGSGEGEGIEINSNDRVFATGATGCGKTYMVKKVTKGFDKVFVYDIEHEYTDNSTHILRTPRDVEHFDFNQTHYYAVYQPQAEDSEKKVIEEFDKVAKCLFRQKNLTVVVDECQRYCDPYNLPDGYYRLVCGGRKRGIGVWSISQRPAQVHKTVIGQVEHAFVGRDFLENDLKWLESFYGRVVWNVQTFGRDDHRLIYWTYGMPEGRILPPI